MNLINHRIFYFPLFLIFIFLYLNSGSQAQRTKKKTPVSVAFFSGTVSTTAPLTLTTASDVRVGIFRAGWFGGIGLTVGPYRMQSNLDWSLQIQLSLNEIRSSDFDINTQVLRYKSDYIPAMFWYRLSVPKDVTPFLRIGVGATYNQNKLRWSGTPEETRSYWTFTWGVGAGLSYRMYLRFSAELFFNLLSMEGSEFLDYTNGYMLIVHDRFMLIPIGVSVSYLF